MTPETNKDVVRRFYEAIDERRDVSVVDDFVSPDYVDHTPAPGCSPDRDGLKQAFRIFYEGSPDGYHVIEDLVGEGDTVVAHVIGRGTHTGDLFGIPANGRKFETRGIAIRRVHDGKIVEHWNVVDMLSVMQQLGVVPDEAPAGS